jgi:hypothetical protein
MKLTVSSAITIAARATAGVAGLGWKARASVKAAPIAFGHPKPGHT